MNKIVSDVTSKIKINIKDCDKGSQALDLILIIALLFFGFYVNRGIIIKGLYMDDLYMWSCYGEQSFFEYVFPIGTSTRFRPAYWLLAYLEMGLIGTHIELFVPVNIIANTIVAILIYFFAKRLSGLRFFGLTAGILYLSSRFSYYQIGQALGLMETEATFMALLILYLLFLSLEGQEEMRARSKKGRVKAGHFRAALLVYFLLAFVHERYISLLPLFFLVLIFKTAKNGDLSFREKRDLFLEPALVFFVIFIIRKLAIGTAIPAGTGGTEVTDTFNVAEALSFAVSQVFYIFGVNAGPEHLNGVTWADTPVNIKVFVKLGALILSVIVFEYLLSLFLRFRGRKEDREKFFEYVKNSLLFILFIAMCIGCSSVTIRVEMRWIYVSYGGALLLCAYMAGIIRETFDSGDETSVFFGFPANIWKKAVSLLLCLLFFAYAMLTLSNDSFYRSCFPKLYFWPDQLRMNSLTEQTYEKYGEDIFGRDIYILENSYGMSDFYGDTFFKTFDPERKAEGTEVHFVDSTEDIPEEKIRSGNILVIKEIPEENAYLDITEEVTDGKSE